MGPIKKKHASGAAKNFITRTQAIKKLQVSLADFRRLCILKGVYPREPRNKKKANKGSTAPVTFYYQKDIQYLLHEPVLQKFREHKSFAKKLSRALGRGEVGDAKRLDDNRPRYTLNHIVKERYPSFLDAVRDLDDPLCMLFLFATLPATDKISHKVTAQAEKLCNQWMAYVAREGLLTKVFVSIKGVYYEAVIRGQPVLWLVPFRFTQNVPTDVDFRIMSTFLEFYTTLVQFVLYRLYNEAGLVYPPKISAQKLKGVGGITAFVLESQAQLSIKQEEEVASTQTPVQATVSAKVDLDLNKAVEKDAQVRPEDDEEDDEDDNVHTVHLDQFTSLDQGDVLAQPQNVDKKPLFANFTFFIGREVPLDILEFLIVALGGRFVSEAALDELLEEDSEETLNLVKGIKKKNKKTEASVRKDPVDLSNITHQICDRPSIPNRVPGRTYIQPQWVFDSINKGELLPVVDYMPGAELPPHLSPWGDRHGYDPEAAVEVAENDEEEEEEEAEEEEEVTGEVEADQSEDDELDEEEKEALQRQKELELEAKGVKFSEAKLEKTPKSKKRTKMDAAAEEKELKKMMMSNKQKKLYNKMQYGLKKKETREEELRKKRRRLEKLKAKA